MSVHAVGRNGPNTEKIIIALLCLRLKILTNFLTFSFSAQLNSEVGMNNDKINFIGWVFFIVSALAFLIASVGNFWSMVGSIFFLIACFVFLIPFFKKK